MNKYSKMGLAFIAGAAVGAIAGLLFAPDKGSETRRKMADKAREWNDAVKEKTKKTCQGACHGKEKFAEEPVA